MSSKSVTCSRGFAIVCALVTVGFYGCSEDRGASLHRTVESHVVGVNTTVKKGDESSNPKTPNRAKLKKMIDKLKPLHRKLGPVKPGDWLESHDEPGQIFDEYVESKPIKATGKRRVIAIQPIGEFDGPRLKILKLTADFIGRYFGLPVRVEKGIPVDSGWPSDARRIHPVWGDRQLHSGHILYDILKPKLPDDAATYLGLTAWDLWPGEGWNFVFGYASIRERVGVWSIYRNGDPGSSKNEFKQVLRRTLKTATHETGHMFSIFHCTAYECNMCGSNSRPESDSHPLAMCPECLAKLVWATGVDPKKRFQSLKEFADDNGLKKEADFWEKSLEALNSTDSE